MGKFAELNPWRRNPWFETVGEAQRRAQKRLPKTIYSSLVAGTQAGVTLDDNMGAFKELTWAPHVVGATAERSLGTTVMGQEIPFPVIISPTGVQAVNPDGEVAVARAAANRGTAMGLSSFASKPVEEVTAVNDKIFFQIYWLGSRDDILARAQRAKEAGCKGLIVTTDWVFNVGRDWGSPEIPERVGLKALAKMAPEMATKPRFATSWFRRGRLTIPDLSAPNIAHKGEQGPTFFDVYGTWMNTPPPTWEDIKWLREQWDGPFMLKGVTRLDDAKRAVDVGVSAISVSNHGGNNLDGTPATIRMLGPIADAVGSDVEVLLDGGIRRGSDVVKALALGAKAVMIGRAYLWGLGANGQAGVENVLDLMQMGIDSALTGLGKDDVAKLGRDDLYIPEGFERRFGG
ncbi:MAG TPA: mycofactocin biosynthesis FMN-dependent deaminase MftD [Gordonia sp. (in: high G+C Gram-positive bacteria)]|uniref:pre-mycofactocin synthase MftD n=1 Tax=unclassified Gordonia (in: high G+C Gram-positive bacteria) TaxID=2657482 RepID=UPI0025BB4605|nr:MULTISPECIES: pre-mycofactocin synthase MftD [unclassified Gordonia (in: high G+C Gram-positive bacteria)]HNP57670.1 mycofactocin biosynthesis FMN-dependent deaminase MftD [Gordonia sp. (in: high G+C Gram-positive bacteria)]HRC50685.1 mycofactocin biosynthesis FMN-dependent deaminase MftD [Gordonia sp. (in: high G+C Gram-positive bacteria)]